MVAGRARLVVTGIQDQWLTGEPQFSYFVMQYKRHSRFAIEAVERPFDGQVGFGQTVTCRIPDNVGDLLRSVTLKVTLGPAALYNTSIGTRIIEHADLLIGGQTVERLTGTYVYMYDQLHNNKDDTEETLFYTTGHGATTPPRTLYVTLPFYFFRHASLAVPICAITKQLVEVRITFKSLDDTIAFGDPGATISAASIIADFFFITEDERNFMRTRPMEYVITQVQLANVPVLPDETTRSALLTFQHPVKELMFVTEDFRPIRRIALTFNGEEVFDRSGTYMAYEQSLRHHTGCPSPAYEFYTYSFALEPEVYFPTGQVNMSRIIHKQLTVDVDGPTVVSVYAINYNVLRVESGLAGLKF